MYSIGVDIGGSHISSGMYGHMDKVLLPETLRYKKINTKESKEVILDSWVCAISKTIEEGGQKVEGIGIAMPGPFDYFQGISLISAVDKLEALYKINIRTELAKRLEMDPSRIRFINDASAFSIAEALVGQATGFRRVAAITLGTGLGSSFLIEGRPIINHAEVPTGGFLYDQLYRGKIADEIFSTRGILSRYTEMSGSSDSNVRDLSERAASDHVDREVFISFGKELGRFLAPHLRKFGAEVLVIGGNISKAYPLFIESLKEQLPKTQIQVSELGEEAAIIGGALLLDETFYEDLIPALKLM